MHAHSHAHAHINAHTHTHTRPDGCLMVVCVCVCVCDVSAGLHRGQSCQRAATPVLSVHDERVTAPWPSGLQLLRGDDCDGDSFGREMSKRKKKRKKGGKNANPRETENRMEMVDCHPAVVRRRRFHESKDERRKLNWGGGEVWLVEANVNSFV